MIDIEIEGLPRILRIQNVDRKDFVRAWREIREEGVKPMDLIPPDVACMLQTIERVLHVARERA